MENENEAVDVTEDEGKFLTTDEVQLIEKLSWKKKFHARERELIGLKTTITSLQKNLFESKLETIARDEQLLVYVGKEQSLREKTAMEEETQCHQTIATKYDIKSKKWGYNPESGEIVDE